MKIRTSLALLRIPHFHDDSVQLLHRVVGIDVHDEKLSTHTTLVLLLTTHSH